MLGMPRAPGAFTIIGGGGADKEGSATWNAVGECSMATTTGPDRSGRLGETAATGVTAARTGGTFVGSGGAAPPTAPAKIRRVMITTPNAGALFTRSARCRTLAAGRGPQRPP